MTDVVVSIRAADLNPDQEVVSDLRELLADAEAGRIRGFALVALQTEQLRLHGLLAFVQRRLLERWENR